MQSQNCSIRRKHASDVELLRLVKQGVSSRELKSKTALAQPTIMKQYFRPLNMTNYIRN